MTQQQLDQLVACLTEVIGARMVSSLRGTGRKKCAERIADLPFGLSEHRAREIVVTEEMRLLSGIEADLSPKAKAVLLAKFYRGVNEAASKIASSMLVEYTHKRAESLTDQIDYNPEANYE